MASISRRKIGGKPRYDVNYREPDGTRRRRTFLKSADAERFKSRVEHEKNTGAYIDPDAGKVTLKSYGEQWLKAQTFDVTSREAVEMHLRLHVYRCSEASSSGPSSRARCRLGSRASRCRAPISG